MPLLVSTSMQVYQATAGVHAHSRLGCCMPTVLCFMWRQLSFCVAKDGLVSRAAGLIWGQRMSWDWMSS